MRKLILGVSTIVLLLLLILTTIKSILWSSLGIIVKFILIVINLAAILSFSFTASYGTYIIFLYI